ncbi:MAG: response regulator [Anaerolineae bacterium]|jgi:DNA-binding NtrC family response regulator|nr:response regulator [Anaerolineae bacterium]MDH7473665.1 response regulator [Anaerolineae bacterium]
MGNKARILIVDDEPGMCEFLEYLLEGEGYEVSTALSGAEGLLRLEENGFALVLADIKMPGMDGIELLRRVRELDKNVVFVVMTAYASMETAIKAIKYGAYDYLGKPFEDTDKILAVIERGVARYQELAAEERLVSKGAQS